MGVIMFGCKCLSWNRLPNFLPPEPETFSLPAPLPNWPQGMRIWFQDLSVLERFLMWVFMNDRFDYWFLFEFADSFTF